MRSAAAQVLEIHACIVSAGFLSAYAAACAGLAADLHTSSCAEVPQHIAETVVVLLWTWRSAMETYSAGEGLCDPAMKPLLLPVAQLAVGGESKRMPNSMRQIEKRRGRLQTSSE
jgi:hypothetical protein